VTEPWAGGGPDPIILTGADMTIADGIKI